MKVVLHCSDSDFGNAAMITKWHLDRGWSTIGYHYVILNGWFKKGVFNRKFDGHLETGRPLDDDNVVESHETGAHVYGFNKGTIGICLIGESDDFSPQQMSELIQLLIDLKEQFGPFELYQHSELDNKKPHCAGLKMEWLKQVIS